MQKTFTYIKQLFAFGIITVSLPFGVVSINSAPPPTGISQPTAINSSSGSNTSRNWSGYESTGGTYTAISGTWTVPNVPSATSTEADATWIGIGGVSGQDLIQAGTQAVINGNGAPTYEAWFETLPEATQQVPVTVSPGDSMSASLMQTSPGEWSVSIRDNTNGQSYQSSIAYNSSLSSAEWIEEMPTTGNSLVPIDNFGSISFSNGMATENGNSVTISGANGQALTMVNNAGQAIATPSSLGSDGESFTVTRTSLPVAVFGSGGSGGSGYFVVGGRGGGLGRGWRRTGVGVQGFTPRPATTSTGAPSSADAGTPAVSGSSYWQQEFDQLFQQLRQLQQQQLQQLQTSGGAFLRNAFLKRGR